MIVRKLLSLMFAVTVLLGTVGLKQASAESKPLVVVSFAGYDKLVADIAMVGKLSGNADLGKQVEMMALMLPQGQGSKGPLSLDTKKPWGAVISVDASAPNYYAFIPVSDIKPMIELVKKQAGQDIKEEKGVYQFPANGKTVYAIQKGDWAFVADSQDQLKTVATDPAALLGDLPKNYDLAIQASMKNLSKEYREQLLIQLRAGAESGLERMPGEGGEAHALRATVAKQSIQQLTMLVNDLDSLLVGWNIDAKTKTTYLDLEMTAQTGTKLAEQFAEIKMGKTDMAGLLLPKAAVTFNSVGAMSDVQVAQAKSALAGLRKTAAKGIDSQGLSEEEAKLVTRLFGDLVDVLEKTIESKKTDVAASVVLDPGAVTIVAGAAIAEGDKLAKVFQELSEEVKKNGELVQSIKLSNETVEGVHLHTVVLPTLAQELTPLFGDTVELAIGTSSDKIVVGVGRNAAKTLKKAIGQLKKNAGKEVSPMEITLAVAPIAKFIGESAEDAKVKTTAAMLAGMLESAGAKNHVVVTLKPVAQGVRLRIELEEGLLKSLGSLTQMMGALPMGGGF
jgi:hypothetical protein